MGGSAYTGRFAPSPTGPLHAGSLVAALASWLDARAHGGRWLVRIEDVDTPRCVTGSAGHILRQLASCGLLPDAEPVYQSARGTLYQRALDQLAASGHAYRCACSRKDIEDTLAAAGRPRPRHGELVYPGTCRMDRQGLQGRPARSWRFLSTVLEPNRPQASVESGGSAPVSIANQTVHWVDRRLGPQAQDVSAEVGDFVLHRAADGLWAYQLAVVVDDAAQGVTQVVRGADLADNTPRQILLQRALGLPTPGYLHTPLVNGIDGHKLSKQNGALPLDTTTPQAVAHTLDAAALALGLPPAEWPHRALTATDHSDALQRWVAAWRGLYNPTP